MLPQTLLSRINNDVQRIAAECRQKQTIWQALDDFIPAAKKELDIHWPESVFMPFGLWPCFLERYFRLPPRSFNLGSRQMRGMAQLMSAIASWRATQDIINFDPELEAELKNMECAGKIPSEILMRIPGWCVYFDAPITTDGDRYDGFFVQLDSRPEGVYLAFTFEAADSRQQRIPLALGDFTLEESVARINTIAWDNGEAKVYSDDPGLVHALNLVTYLCAYGFADKQGYAGPGDAMPRPKKTKKGWRIFPPESPRIHTLGSDFGEAIRKEYAVAKITGTATKRPHIRRPHWHGFWTGAHDSPHRKLQVRWLPPILVGNTEKQRDDDL